MVEMAHTMPSGKLVRKSAKQRCELHLPESCMGSSKCTPPKEARRRRTPVLPTTPPCKPPRAQSKGVASAEGLAKRGRGEVVATSVSLPAESGQGGKRPRKGCP